MHVGGFNLFTLPEGTNEQEFLHGLADNMRTADALQPPFGDKLKVGRMGMLGPLFAGPGVSHSPLGAAQARAISRTVRAGIPFARHLAGPQPPAVGDTFDRGFAGASIRCLFKVSSRGDRRGALDTPYPEHVFCGSE